MNTAINTTSVHCRTLAQLTAPVPRRTTATLTQTPALTVESQEKMTAMTRPNTVKIKSVRRKLARRTLNVQKPIIVSSPKVLRPEFAAIVPKAAVQKISLVNWTRHACWTNVRLRIKTRLV